MFHSVAGYDHAVKLNTSSHFLMFAISERRALSLADEDWLEKERNAIVANIASITITTISSTRVKAELTLLLMVFIII